MTRTDGGAYSGPCHNVAVAKVQTLSVKERGVMFGRISIDPKICHGQACVKGTRIPVHQIVRMLANGDTIEQLLVEYPSLTKADVPACLD